MSEKGVLKRFWIWELTRPAFEEWLENEPAPVVVIGVGVIRILIILPLFGTVAL